MTVPATALTTAVEIEADRFQNLKYDEPSFQKEARAVLGEYNKSASSPFLKLNEALQDTAFVKHTYKHTTIGFLADVKDMPNQYAYSKVFFDRWYRPENCTLIVTGDVKHDDLVSLAKQYYGSWKRGSRERGDSGRAFAVGTEVRASTWPSPTLPTLLLGYHIPAGDPRNADTPVLNVLAQLVFGETSPLYEELVLKEQKVVQLCGRCRLESRSGFIRGSGAGAQVRGSAFVRAANCEGIGRGSKSPSIPEAECDQIAPSVSICRRAGLCRRGC